MADVLSLVPRMDAFMASLLDAADSAKDGGGDDSGARASLTERVAAFKAATDYLKVRKDLTGGGAEKEPEKPPEIDGLITRLRTADRARRR
jgi:hypothetical protein